MSVECFLDTNILLYAVSGAPEEQFKRRRAFEIVNDAKFGISAQVLQEFYVIATRKAHHCASSEEAVGWLERWAVAPCISIDFELVQLGIHLSERYRISYWDGAIIAAAQEMGAEILYSEDLNHEQKYGAVQVVNPFAGLN